MKAKPDYSLAWKLIGDILYEQNNIVNASKYYRKTIELDSNDIETKITLANCEYMMENYQEAVKLYEDIKQNSRI